MLGNFDFGKIEVEMKGVNLEKIINLLWNKGAGLLNVKKIDAITMRFMVEYKDFQTIKSYAENKNINIKIVGASSLLKYILKINEYVGRIIGVVVFVLGIYYCSTYVWKINVKTEHYLSPYEVRQRLKTLNVETGIKENDMDEYKIEEELISKYDDIMWAKIRKIGGILNVDIIERQDIDKEEKLEEPEEQISSDLVAKQDGEIISIYSTNGTPIVEKGMMVKKGDLLIEGMEGKEGSEYEVEAKGRVMAKTYYQYTRNVVVSGEKYEPIGNNKKDIYLDIFGKKVYLKKTDVKFEKYDKIESKMLYLKVDTYRELKLKKFNKDSEKLRDKIVKDIENEIKQNIGKKGEIDSKIVTDKIDNGILTMSVVFVVIEDIAN